jgi:predicted DNA-binding transcriptional regulator AlpA
LSTRTVIRRREVRRRTGYSDTTIWRMEAAGTFPARFQLNPEAAGPYGAVGWYEDEVDAWIRKRVRGIGEPLPIKGGRKPEPAMQTADAEVV